MYMTVSVRWLRETTRNHETKDETEIFMKTGIAVTFAATILFVASASAESNLQAVAHQMMKCYELEGYKFGLQTCNPPGELVEAVFGKCAAEEQRFRGSLIEKKRLESHYSPDQLAEYSGHMVRDIRAEFQTRIQAQIMDARLTVNKRCYR